MVKGGIIQYQEPPVIFHFKATNHLTNEYKEKCVGEIEIKNSFLMSDECTWEAVFELANSSIEVQNIPICLAFENNNLSERLERAKKNALWKIKSLNGTRKVAIYKTHGTYITVEMSNCTDPKLILEHYLSKRSDLEESINRRSRIQNKCDDEIKRREAEHAAKIEYLEKELKYTKTKYEKTEQYKHHEETKWNKYSNMCPKRRDRIVEMLKSDIDESLSYLNEYGLQIKRLKLMDDKNQTINISFDETTEAAKKRQVEDVIYVLDRYRIADDAYHELCMVEKSLPRQHRIKEKRKEINDGFDVIPLEGGCEGAYVSAKEAIENAIIRRTKEKVDTSHLMVKIAGDGARYKHSASFVQIGLQFFGKEKEPLKNENKFYTIAVGRGKEDYAFLKEAFGKTFDELNAFIRQGEFRIDNNVTKLEFILSGDMKFLTILQGISSVMSKFSCIYCHANKSMQQNTTVAFDHFENASIGRNDDDDNMNRKFRPLIDLPVSQIILDELHLYLRITEKLIRPFVQFVVNLDMVNKTEIHASTLLSALRKLSICGEIIHDRTDKKSVPELNLRSAKDMKKMLSVITPGDFMCTTGANKQCINKLWDDWNSLYQLLCQDCNNESEAKAIYEKSKVFFEDYNSCCKILNQVETTISPYMHCLMYHIPHQLLKFKNIKKFTGQHIEKSNDSLKVIHHRKTNKRNNPFVQMLATCKRIEYLSPNKREVRKYDNSGRAQESIQTFSRMKFTVNCNCIKE